MADISITFWSIFHALIRHKKEEPERTKLAGGWLAAEYLTLRSFALGEELEFLAIMYESYETNAFTMGPSLALLRQNIEAKNSPALDEKLVEYLAVAKDLPVFTNLDLPAKLVEKGKEFRNHRATVLFRNAQKIVGEGAEVKDEITRKPRLLKGSADAVRYLFTKLDSGIGQNPTATPTHGTLQASSERLESIYDEITNPTNTKGRVIPVGIASIDNRVRMRKGDFVGVLGYAGAGKTRFCRGWVYNAVSKGFNCLHFSMEQTFEEELIRYALIHAVHPQWGLDHTDPRIPTLEAYTDGTLTAKQRDFLFNAVIPDLREGSTMSGLLTIRQPTEGSTWEVLKSLIHASNQSANLDMVCVDYLTMVDTDLRNHKEEMATIIQSAKTLAMGFNDGQGLLFVTPVQASRRGWEIAKKNQGQFDLDAIYQYSQYEKAVDTMVTVFSDDDLDAEAKVAIGTVKYRRGKNLNPTKVGVLHSCGVYKEVTNRVLPQAQIDQLIEFL